MRTDRLAPSLLEPLGEANKAATYLSVARDVFERNRTTQYPYIKDIGIEGGPLLLLLGHGAELIFKSFIRSVGVKQTRIQNFKGFKYTVEETGASRRIKKTAFRRHDVVFLFRIIRTFCKSRSIPEGITTVLGKHSFHRENYEIFLNLPQKPTFEDFCGQLEILNANFDSPFRARYFQHEYGRLPDCEVLLVVLEHLEERLRNEFSDNFNGTKA